MKEMRGIKYSCVDDVSEQRAIFDDQRKGVRKCPACDQNPPTSVASVMDAQRRITG